MSYAPSPKPQRRPDDGKPVPLHFLPLRAVGRYVAKSHHVIALGCFGLLWVSSRAALVLLLAALGLCFGCIQLVLGSRCGCSRAALGLSSRFSRLALGLIDLGPLRGCSGAARSSVALGLLLGLLWRLLWVCSWTCLVCFGLACAFALRSELLEHPRGPDWGYLGLPCDCFGVGLRLLFLALGLLLACSRLALGLLWVCSGLARGCSGLLWGGSALGFVWA